MGTLGHGNLGLQLSITLSEYLSTYSKSSSDIGYLRALSDVYETTSGGRDFHLNTFVTKEPSIIRIFLISDLEFVSLLHLHHGHICVEGRYDAKPCNILCCPDFVYV